MLVLQYLASMSCMCCCHLLRSCMLDLLAVVMTPSFVVGRNYAVPFSGMTSFNYVEDIAEIFLKCVLSNSTLTCGRCVFQVKEGAHTCSIEGDSASMPVVDSVLALLDDEMMFTQHVVA